MWWRAFDTALERIRDRIRADPAGAREEIRELLKSAGPSGRVRLWGLEITACIALDDVEGGLRAYEQGRKLRGTALAHSELEGRAARLLITRRDLAAASTAADRAVSLIRPLALAPGKGSPRGTLHVRAMYGAALVVRAQAGSWAKEPASRLLGDVFEAFRWIDPRFAPSVHLAAVSTLATLLTQNATSPEHLQTALRLEGEAQDLLRRRRVRACHPHRAQLRGIRALALAKLGAVERAEQIMRQRVIPDLRAAGLDSTADEAAEQLLWIVAERAGQVGRASYLRSRHGLPPPKTPQPKTPKDDPGDPIGF